MLSDRSDEKKVKKVIGKDIKKSDKKDSKSGSRISGGGLDKSKDK